MSSPRPLVPLPVEARARSNGRLPFSFGMRFLWCCFLAFFGWCPRGGRRG